MAGGFLMWKTYAGLPENETQRSTPENSMDKVCPQCKSPVLETSPTTHAVCVLTGFKSNQYTTLSDWVASCKYPTIFLGRRTIKVKAR